MTDPPSPPGDTTADDIRVSEELGRERDRRYDPQGLLGRGGMAEVELCLDQRLQRPVARKHLRPELQDHAECRRRFAREVQIQAQLDHPSIVPVFDWGHTAEGRAFFTMRRIGGRTMAQAIEQLAQIPYPDGRARERRRLLGAFLRACLAVDYAHSRGVVHRDIKPDNLMLGRFGELYVLDWGVAKVRSDAGVAALRPQPLAGPAHLTEGRQRLGTPQFMSPEQHADPAQASARSDVYSLGAVLFEILTGRPLRTGPGWPVGEALRPSRLDPTLPPEYDAICRGACAPELAERTPSARALHDAVEAVLQGDRDAALRHALAEEHLERARAHAGAGREAEAMREAGRALALEPASAEAGELVAGYLLAGADPAPLRAERRAADHDSSRSMLRANAAAVGAILLVVLLLIAANPILRPGLLLAAVLPAVLGGLVLAFTAPGPDRSAAAIARSVLVSVGFSAPIAFSAAAFGPWVLPPLVACATCTIVAAVVAIGWRRVLVAGSALLTLLATLAAYAAADLGFSVGSEGLRAEPVMLGFAPVVTHATVAALSAALVVASAAVVWRNVDALLRSRQQRHRDAWRLRQLAALPSGPDPVEDPASR